MPWYDILIPEPGLHYNWEVQTTCVYADIILTTTPTHPLKMRSVSAVVYDILIPEPGLHYNCYTLLHDLYVI